MQDAVHDLKAAFEIDRNNADTLLLLMNCYLISGKVSAARPLNERALSLDPLKSVTRCMPVVRLTQVTQLAHPWTHARTRQLPRDPVVELKERLRHPIRWHLRHPLQANCHARRRACWPKAIARLP
ncbi:MAG: tetratricopeptide repeat protein [Acidobacteria bacterium]|nr:tetratricopeptide repeat protein [Acidobacteriota bacterium]